METVEVEALVQAVVIEDRRVHHVVIDGDAAAAIRLAAMTGQWVGRRRGFGAARVTATVGGTVWQTALFPHRESGGWFLPLKAAVCRAERLEQGAMVRVRVAL